MNAGVWLHFKIIYIFPFQVRTSYVPTEILWGYRFEHKCVSYDKAQSQMTRTVFTKLSQAPNLSALSSLSKSKPKILRLVSLFVTLVRP